MKHSPKPWTTDGLCVFDADHKLIATLSGFGHEAIATRRLIVAAPELLEAVSQAFDVLGQLAEHCAFEDDAPEFNEGGTGYEARQVLRKVISQATEKQT